MCFLKEMKISDGLKTKKGGSVGRGRQQVVVTR